MSFQIPVWPWLQKPAPASPVFDRAIQPGPRWSPFVGHMHVYQPQPFPGASAFAFEALGLVEFSPIGPATMNRGHLDPLAPPPLFAGHGLPVQGLGGLVTGQIISQPLVNATTEEEQPLGEPGENWTY